MEISCSPNKANLPTGKLMEIQHKTTQKIPCGWKKSYLTPRVHNKKYLQKKKIKVKSKKKLESSQTIPKLLKLFEKQKSALSHKQRLAFMAAALGAGKQSLWPSQQWASNSRGNLVWTYWIPRYTHKIGQSYYTTRYINSVTRIKGFQWEMNLV